jgi:hypothetical protein
MLRPNFCFDSTFPKIGSDSPNYRFKFLFYAQVFMLGIKQMNLIGFEMKAAKRTHSLGQICDHDSTGSDQICSAKISQGVTSND